MIRRTILTAAALFLAAAGTAQTASARDSFSFSIGLPGLALGYTDTGRHAFYSGYVAPAVSYVSPPVTYVNPPVVYSSAPVYDAYYDYPAVSYIAPPVYVRPAPVYYRPVRGYYGGHWDRGWDGRHGHRR